MIESLVIPGIVLVAVVGAGLYAFALDWWE